MTALPISSRTLVARRIPIINDNIAEAVEYFGVALSDPQGTDILAGHGTIIVIETPPETDAFAQAQPVLESVPSTGEDNAVFVSTSGATPDGPNAAQGGPEVWYSYRPPGDGTATFQLMTQNSSTCNGALTITIYTGPDLAHLTQKAISGCTLNLQVSAGTTYWTAIGNQTPTTPTTPDQYDLNWLDVTRTPGPPPPPDPKGASVSGAVVAEGDSGFTPVEVTVSLSEPLSTTASVAYATEERSPFPGQPEHFAEAGSDYQPTSGRDPRSRDTAPRTTVITDTHHRRQRCHECPDIAQ